MAPFLQESVGQGKVLQFWQDLLAPDLYWWQIQPNNLLVVLTRHPTQFVQDPAPLITKRCDTFLDSQVSMREFHGSRTCLHQIYIGGKYSQTIFWWSSPITPIRSRLCSMLWHISKWISRFWQDLLAPDLHRGQIQPNHFLVVFTHHPNSFKALLHVVTHFKVNFKVLTRLACTRSISGQIQSNNFVVPITPIRSRLCSMLQHVSLGMSEFHGSDKTCFRQIYIGGRYSQTICWWSWPITPPNSFKALLLSLQTVVTNFPRYERIVLTRFACTRSISVAITATRPISSRPCSSLYKMLHQVWKNLMPYLIFTLTLFLLQWLRSPPASTALRYTFVLPHLSLSPPQTLAMCS